ncbi:MAG TPA: GNAT family N-acetyltransferase [Anaerolineae bacterium]|nr:GNAT family N-acetyltransferase [Anaerolineae bacterium]
MIIRSFEPEDAEGLSQLIIQNLRQVNSQDYSTEAIEALIPSYTPEKLIELAGQQLTLVSVMGDEVVGTATLDCDRVRNVFVEVALHQKGIGRELMLAIEDHARQRRFKKLFLLSGLSAQGFYQKLGYTIVKRFDNDLNGIPLPVVQMEKDLGVFLKSLDEIQPSQLFVSSGKLSYVMGRFDPPTSDSLDPIPVKMLDNDVIFTDGHTRALAAFLRGLPKVRVFWDEDDLDWEAYRICVEWCKTEGIFTIADLKERVISPEDYEVLWHARCREMQQNLEACRNIK